MPLAQRFSGSRKQTVLNSGTEPKRGFMKKTRLTGIACIIIIAVFCVAATVAAPSQTYTVVTGFNPTQGSNPTGPLAQGVDGNLYGTTETGGNSNSICPAAGGTLGSGCGSIFKVTPSGQLTTIYEFCSLANCSDGAVPLGSLLLAANGNFYGVTSVGGAADHGTVFEITPTGTLTTLYSFCAQTNCTDGANPPGTLIQGVNGNIYGTTNKGGAHQSSACKPTATVVGCGTIFQITPSGQLTTLYSFCALANCADGELPVTPLTQGTDGNIYGTTTGGGVVNTKFCGSTGCGTVFQITPTGTLTTIHKFCTVTVGTNPCGDGASPDTALVQVSNDSMVGTAGNIFSITAAGKLTVLLSGLRAVEGFTVATDGNIYGVTFSGGVNNSFCSGGASTCGTIFKMSASGAFNTIYSFCQDGSADSCPDGALPVVGLMQATNGNLYGATFFGGPVVDVSCNAIGNGGCGTVFTAPLGISPFVQAVTNFGRAGYNITILGNNLTGTTGVTFNGTPATFTVVSDTQINAKVPSGATTGIIQVTTPTANLNSNVAFQVEP